MRACYDTAVAYGTPYISGKDSMFNDFKGYDEKGNSVAISIPPTLLISSISVMKDFKKSVSPEFKVAGDAIYVLGGTHDELGASEYFKMIGKEGNEHIHSVICLSLFKNDKVISGSIDETIIG